MKRMLFFCLMLLAPFIANSQGTAYGFKGGVTLADQGWQGSDFSRRPLLGYHGVVSIESLSGEGKFSLFAQLGYHQRGTALRFNFNRGFFRYDNPEQYCLVPDNKFLFHNVALALGGKNRFPVGSSLGYYGIGIRLEYTVGTNLRQFSDYNIDCVGFPQYPYPEAVRKINYGVIAMAGLEIPFNELLEGVLELSVSPDFSRQYESPTVLNFPDPRTGNPRTIQERLIRNVSVEISLGLRFLQIVEYID